MPQADITVIGTAHRRQVAGEEGADAFEQFILSHPKTVGCAAIVEEMSHDALRSPYNATETVGMRVADKLTLGHLLCDPGDAARVSGRMLTYRILKHENDGKPHHLRSSQAEIEQQAEEAWHRRECYWLDGMCELNRWPVLFTCGAWHVPTIAAKARKRGLSVEIAEADWPDREPVPPTPWLLS